MSVAAIQNAMRLQALMAGVGNVSTRIGIVTSYDPDAYAAKVTMQPDSYETGWLPVCSPWVGNGWGLFCPPTAGDQVAVHFQEGALEAGFVGMRLYSDDARPLSVPSGEFWIQHKSGSKLQFLNDGDVQVTTNRDMLATVGRHLNATVGGNVSANVAGSITATTGSTASLTATTSISLTAPNIGLNGNVTQTGTGGSGGTMTINSPMHSTSTILADQAITSAVDVIGNGISLHNHSHGDPQGGTVGTPI